MTPWDSGRWLREPVHRLDGPDLLVTADQGSDFWRTTSYGFVRDSGHALLVDLAPGTAVEVDFVLDFDQLYDQAGLLVRVDETTWTKAGVEVTDGAPHVGAVVTRGVSDWSLAPVPDWQGRLVSVRGSRQGDALSVRARVEGEPWRLVRLAPLAADAPASAGLFCCSPERAGLTVRFRRLAVGAADADLHDPGLG